MISYSIERIYLVVPFLKKYLMYKLDNTDAITIKSVLIEIESVADSL